LPKKTFFQFFPEPPRWWVSVQPSAIHALLKPCMSCHNRCAELGLMKTHCARARPHHRCPRLHGKCQAMPAGPLLLPSALCRL
jgi:hypothetical protein